MSETTRPTILLVEDHPMILRVTQRMLDRLGYAVFTAVTGAEALTLCDTHPAIDCVILDLGLPDMSGADVLTELRRRREDVQVIVSSGSSPGASGDIGPGPRPDAYLDKPYTLAELRAALAGLPRSAPDPSR